MGPGGQVIGVVFSRSTVYANVGYALTSPGVLARVQVAEQRRSAVEHRQLHLGLSSEGARMRP